MALAFEFSMNRLNRMLLLCNSLAKRVLQLSRTIMRNRFAVMFACALLTYHTIMMSLLALSIRFARKWRQVVAQTVRTRSVYANGSKPCAWRYRRSFLFAFHQAHAWCLCSPLSTSKNASMCMSGQRCVQ